MKNKERKRCRDEPYLGNNGKTTSWNTSHIWEGVADYSLYTEDGLVLSIEESITQGLQSEDEEYARPKNDGTQEKEIKIQDKKEDVS